MIEIKGNIFDFKGDAICITTNGVVKANKEAVMGAGIALQAKNRFPFLPIVLGQKILECGNGVYLLGETDEYSIVSFPTKNHWKEKSDLSLIKKSILDLVRMANNKNWNRICLTRPGCGNGKLEWGDVKKYIDLLDDRFFVIHE